MIQLQFTGLFLDPRLSYNMGGTLREIINAHQEIVPAGQVVIGLALIGCVWRLFSQNPDGTGDILATRVASGDCSAKTQMEQGTSSLPEENHIRKTYSPETAMDCSSCGRYVGELGDQKASIAVLKGGDEHIYSYFSCDECGTYTVEVYHDFFITGESTILLLPPLSNEEGNGILELIGRCPDRNDKSCDCEAHKFHE